MRDRKVGVVLAGAGHLDGSEIHEATLTLLALDRAGARVLCAAPRRPQLHVMDHARRQPVEGERREIFTEAARIARGNILPLETLDAAELDALVFPGGFGVAKNLCNFATAGAAMEVLPEVDALIQRMHALRRPMGFICIAPVLAAKVLGKHRPLLTIGDDAKTARALEAMGAIHRNTPVEETLLDPVNRLLSTPAYMYETSIARVERGISRLVSELRQMLGS